MAGNHNTAIVPQVKYPIITYIPWDASKLAITGPIDGFPNWFYSNYIQIRMGRKVLLGKSR